MYFVFQNRQTGLYYNSWEDVQEPEKASPKFGDQNSAFMYADDHYEGQVDAKMRFKQTYEIVGID